MSDNGMTGGGSGQPGKDLAPGYPFFNGNQTGLKGSTDEGGVRVPFFIRWDGRVKPGRDINTLAAHIDVLPTLAALAGAQLPNTQVEGRSLLPLIESTDKDWPDRYLYTHVARWPTGSEPNDYQHVNYGVRNQRFRLVGPRAGNQNQNRKERSAAVRPSTAQLFDLEADPLQTKNVAAEHPEVVEKMNAAYDAFWKEARPMMINETAPMSSNETFS